MTNNLSKAVQRLLDHQEIDLVVTRLYQLIDLRDTSRFSEFVIPELADGMAAGMEQMMSWQATQHIITDRDITVSGDNAVMRANLIGTSMGPQLPGRARDSFESEGREQFEVRGRYQFAFSRTDNGWRIANIDVEYLWTSGAPMVGTA